MEIKKLTDVAFMLIKHSMEEANHHCEILKGFMVEYPDLKKSATPEQYEELEKLIHENDKIQRESEEIVEQQSGN